MGPHDPALTAIWLGSMVLAGLAVAAFCAVLTARVLGRGRAARRRRLTLEILSAASATDPAANACHLVDAVREAARAGVLARTIVEAMGLLGGAARERFLANLFTAGAPAHLRRASTRKGADARLLARTALALFAAGPPPQAAMQARGVVRRRAA
jgi:hypothetical protein